MAPKHKKPHQKDGHQNKESQSIDSSSPIASEESNSCKLNGHNFKDEKPLHNGCNGEAHSPELTTQEAPSSPTAAVTDSLEKAHLSENPTAAATSTCLLEKVTYVQYQSELQMPDIMRLIQKDLSEPYSIYTYRYFIHNWPMLCFLVIIICVTKNNYQG